MPNLLLVAETDQVSGPGNSWLEYVHLLNPDEFRGCLVCPGEGPLSARFREIGISTHTIAYPRLRKSIDPRLLWQFASSAPRVVAQLEELIRKEQADLVQVNTIINLWGAIASWRAGTPLLWHIHELIPRNLVNRLIHRFVASTATQIVVVSDAVKQRFLAEGVPESKVHVIHNGLRLAPFDAVGPDTIMHTRSSLGMTGDSIGVGIVGRITPSKGHSELVAALARVAPQFPSVRLVIAGEFLSPAYEAELRAQIQKLGLQQHVVLAGHQSDIPSLMNSLDLLVAPSTAPDSLPLAVLEGMAARLPVLASRVGGIPEEVIHGETGLLVAPGDAEALAEELLALLKDASLRQSLGRRGRARVERLFTAERMAQEFAELYHSMVE